MKVGKGGSLRIWRQPELESVELRLGTLFRHPYPRHWHEEFFFSAITAGAGHFGFRGNNQLVGPGALVLIVPGEVHTHHDSQGGRSFRSMHLPGDVAADLAMEVTQCKDSLARLASGVLTNAGVLRVFLRFHRFMEGDGTRLHRESLLRCFFSKLFVAIRGCLPASTPGAESRALRRAQELLHAYYDQPVSLKNLAATANLSPYYFHRAFCRMTGMPPHAYQVHLRILRAKAMLRDGWPIAHVASVTGFADQSHFTRHFKRMVGVTPAHYPCHRKNVQDARPFSC